MEGSGFMAFGPLLDYQRRQWRRCAGAYTNFSAASCHEYMRKSLALWINSRFISGLLKECGLSYRVSFESSNNNCTWPQSRYRRDCKNAKSESWRKLTKDPWKDREKSSAKKEYLSSKRKRPHDSRFFSQAVDRVRCAWVTGGIPARTMHRTCQPPIYVAGRRTKRK